MRRARRPELPRRHEGSRALRRGTGRRGHALRRPAARAVPSGGRVSTTPDGRLERARGRRGHAAAVRCHELQRLRPLAGARGASTPTPRHALRWPRPAAGRSPSCARRTSPTTAAFPARPSRPRRGRQPDRPTDERLRATAHGEDPALVALVFQYGRYLLIASSRPGTQPANLQGIWNDEMRPPWSAQLDAEHQQRDELLARGDCNLAECHEPLLQFIARPRAERRARPRASTTARAAGSPTTTPTCGASPAPSATGARATPRGPTGRMGGVWHCWTCGSATPSPRRALAARLRLAAA